MSVIEGLHNESVRTILKVYFMFHNTKKSKAPPKELLLWSLPEKCFHQRVCLVPMPKRRWFACLSTNFKEEICKSRSQRAFVIRGRSTLFIESSVFLYWHKKYSWAWSSLSESRLKTQSPGLIYYKFSREGLLWDKQPFEMFFSWNTHPLVSFTFQFTYVVLFVLVLHRMQLSQSLLPKVIRNAGSPSDRADGAHSPLLSKQSKKPKKKKNKQQKKTPADVVQT